MDNQHLEIWQKYTDCWSNPDAGNRKQILSQIMTAETAYTDPYVETVGIDALSDYMQQFQADFPGGKFVVTDFNVHHEQGLVHWDMVNGEGTLLGKGISFGVYQNGQLAKETGFFFET